MHLRYQISSICRNARLDWIVQVGGFTQDDGGGDGLYDARGTSVSGVPTRGVCIIDSNRTKYAQFYK